MKLQLFFPLLIALATTSCMRTASLTVLQPAKFTVPEKYPLKKSG